MIYSSEDPPPAGNAALQHRRTRPVRDLVQRSPTDEAGARFDGQCAVLCGAKHADTRAAVRAVTPEECEVWAEEHREAIMDAAEDLVEHRDQRESQAG
jgi:heme/copper-type cytochrome/quinol oxidase subunit 2